MIRPTILFENKNTLEELNQLKAKERLWAVRDLFEQQVEEWYDIKNPAAKFSPDYRQQLEDFIAKVSQPKNSQSFVGNWVYLPWLGVLVHTVNEELLNELRTNRNQNLIKDSEQRTLLDFKIGIAGLSIGSQIALSLVYNGIGRVLKLAEFDQIGTTNLNRLRGAFYQVGDNKLDVTATQIFQINPYARLIGYGQGLNDANLDGFINGKPKLDLVFDCIDDFKMKIKLRLKAKEAKVPVLMMTNLGDRVLIDIERYDLNPKSKLFNGLLGNVPEQILKSPLSEKDKRRFAVELVGIENIPTRALQSLTEINKSLSGRPQLNSTVTASSGIATILARKIALNEKIKSGRFLIDFEQVLGFESAPTNP